jgi:hypothetical protein
MLLRTHNWTHRFICSVYNIWARTTQKSSPSYCCVRVRRGDYRKHRCSIFVCASVAQFVYQRRLFTESALSNGSTHHSINHLGYVNSSVCIATGYGLDYLQVGARVPVGSRFFFLHVDQAGTEAYPASYPKGTGGSFPWGKAAGAWNWPLTPN